MEWPTYFLANISKFRFFFIILKADYKTSCPTFPKGFPRVLSLLKEDGKASRRYWIKKEEKRRRRKPKPTPYHTCVGPYSLSPNNKYATQQQNTTFFVAFFLSHSHSPLASSTSTSTSSSLLSIMYFILALPQNTPNAFAIPAVTEIWIGLGCDSKHGMSPLLSARWGWRAVQQGGRGAGAEFSAGSVDF